MNESELTEGCLIAFETFNCTTIRGFYFSFRHLLPNAVDVEKLAWWGMLFKDEETYRLIRTALYTAQSCDDYWHEMQSHAPSWGNQEYMQKYGYIEVRNSRCTRLPGRGIGPLERGKRRRGKRHRMRSVSLPVYPTPGMEPIHEEG